MIQTYAEAGYRVTVICTLFKNPEGIELRPEVMKWTHDVHVLPAIMRPNDFPRYIKHLISSRGSREVIFSNSQLIYEMLPALVEQMPNVKFIDVSLKSFRLERERADLSDRLAVPAQRGLRRLEVGRLSSLLCTCPTLPRTHHHLLLLPQGVAAPGRARRALPHRRRQTRN